ncbi:ABC transporter ATP-binding protein [Mariniluteicoccus flavus]
MSPTPSAPFAPPLPTGRPGSPGPDHPPALQLVDVRKAYAQGPDAVIALRGIDLTLSRGSFTAVMGPSGSGKSTFLNCAAGLGTPTSGTIHVGDTELSGRSADFLTKFRRDRLGFVFQAYNLVPQLTVAQNVGLPLLLAGRPADHARQTELLEAVGLGGMERRTPGELSGGQAQRVALARALMTTPEVLFADEPTGALDSRTGAQIIRLLRSAVESSLQTIVLVTHDRSSPRRPTGFCSSPTAASSATSSSRPRPRSQPT